MTASTGSTDGTAADSAAADTDEPDVPDPYAPYAGDPDGRDPDGRDRDGRDPGSATRDEHGAQTDEHGTVARGDGHGAHAGDEAHGTDGRGEPDRGPIDAVAARRIAGADVAVIATADRDGERDVTVLAGPRCFLRVLDDHRMAWPDQGTDPAYAYRSNLVEVPQIAVLLLSGEPGGRDRAGLHLNGTAGAVPVAELRAEHPDLPVDPVPGRPTDVWVVVDVGDAYPLDGDDAPPVGLAGASPAVPAEPSRTGASRPAVLGLLGLVLVLLVAVVALGLGAASGPGGTSGPGGPVAGGPAPAPAAPAAPAGPVVLFGTVTAVPDPATVVVDVEGTPRTVEVLGISAETVPPCAQGPALDFARTTLLGETVTLVPDPTLPSSPTPRAYVVLGSQLSYTDAAIRAGWAVPTGPAQYRGVFDDERREAEAAGVGMWGPPCVP